MPFAINTIRDGTHVSLPAECVSIFLEGTEYMPNGDIIFHAHASHGKPPIVFSVADVLYCLVCPDGFSGYKKSYLFYGVRRHEAFVLYRVLNPHSVPTPDLTRYASPNITFTFGDVKDGYGPNEASFFWHAARIPHDVDIATENTSADPDHPVYTPAGLQFKLPGLNFATRFEHLPPNTPTSRQTLKETAAIAKDNLLLSLAYGANRL